MKNLKFFSAGIAVLLLMVFLPVKTMAQEQQESDFTVNADVYSSFIWRGSKLGTGPAFQPSVKFSGGGLTVGVWGSFDANGYSEADPYISYSFPFGLSLGLTDYYLPGLSFFETSKETGSHAFELNAGFTKGRITLGANYIFNEAGGIASAGGDKYFQIGYSFSNVSLIAGAGDGWYTSDGEFDLCNISIGASKILQITEKFALPLSGQVILNPEKQMFYVVAGFSF